MIKCGKNSREIIINIILLILYSILTLIVAIHHEPYADEAQQWLIARGCTFFEMIFNVAKYEGTPMLWHSFLRVLNFFHFPYEELFIIPWILGSFACYLFLFKSKFPLILKILFPFTYFIFYQYAIIAKNHSLLFPLLFLIAVNYKNRRKKSLLYLLLLMLLASSSAYGFAIAFILLCFYTFDIIQIKERKYYIGIILSFLFMLFTVIYVKKAPDCYFLGLGGMDFSLFMLPYTFVDAFFGYRVLELLPQRLEPIPLAIVFLSLIISTITFYYSICKTLCKNQYQLIFFITINFLITVSIAILYYEA